MDERGCITLGGGVLSKGSIELQLIFEYQLT